MDKYLINILKEISTIIIPGIGALTIVNHSTGEVMFMPFMKFDDEKLAKYIAEKEQWQLNDAKNLVSKYVRDIETKLAQGDSYDIYQFGSFTKNSGGEIEFKAWNRNSHSNSNSEISAVTSIEKSETLAEVITDVVEKTDAEVEGAMNEKIELVELISQPNEFNKKKVIEEEIVAKTEQTNNEDPILKHSDSIDKNEPIISLDASIETQMLSVEEQLKDDLDVPPVNLKQELRKKPILEKASKDKIKKKRGIGFYFLIVFLIALIGGGAYFGANYQEMKQYFPFLADKSNQKIPNEAKIKKEEFTKEENKEVQKKAEELAEILTESEVSADSINQDQLAEVVTIGKQPTNTNRSSIDKNLPIQVIVGSFSEKSNAIRMVDKLKSQGLDAEIIGRFSGLYFVSAGSYSSMTEMKLDASEINSLGKYWVYRK